MPVNVVNGGNVANNAGLLVALRGAPRACRKLLTNFERKIARNHWEAAAWDNGTLICKVKGNDTLKYGLAIFEARKCLENGLFSKTTSLPENPELHSIHSVLSEFRESGRQKWLTRIIPPPPRATGLLVV